MKEEEEEKKKLKRGSDASKHFSKKVHEPLVLFIKVQKPPLYLSWKVQN